MPDSITLPDGRKLDSLKVADLKTELETLGLDKSGLKKDLVQRLARALQQQTDGNERLAPRALQDTSSDNLTGSTLPKGTMGAAIEETPLEDCTDPKSDADESADLIETQLKNAAIDPPSMDFKPSASNEDCAPEVVSVEATEMEKSVEVTQQPPQQDEEEQEGEEVTAETPKKPAVSPSPPAQQSSVQIQPPQRPASMEDSGDLDQEEEDYEEDDSFDHHGVVGVEQSTKQPPTPKTTVTTTSANGESKLATPEKEETSASQSKPLSKEEKRTVAAAVKPSPVKSKPLKETRGVGFFIEGPERIKPAAEAKCPPSQLVYIRCLVRPFTAGQLTSMIEANFAKPVGDLWLDRIKSSAVVRLPTAEAAKSCREGLDGCRWPSINPRIMQCEFASEELFEWLRQHGENGDRAPPKYLIGEAPAETSGSTKRSLGASGGRSGTTEKESIKKRPRLAEADKAISKEEPAPKLLDDIFKKTTTTPPVYWLSLTDEAAKDQLKARQSRHVAEMSRRQRQMPQRSADERRRETRSPFASRGDVNPRRSNDNSNAAAVDNKALPGVPSTHSAAPSQTKGDSRRSPSPRGDNNQYRRSRHSPRSPPAPSRRPPAPQHPQPASSRYARRTPSPSGGGGGGGRYRDVASSLRR